MPQKPEIPPQIDCDESAPIPRSTTLTLECDAVSGFFCRSVEVFAEGEFVANGAAASTGGGVKKRERERERWSICGGIGICGGVSVFTA